MTHSQPLPVLHSGINRVGAGRKPIRQEVWMTPSDIWAVGRWQTSGCHNKLLCSLGVFLVYLCFFSCPHFWCPHLQPVLVGSKNPPFKFQFPEYSITTKHTNTREHLIILLISYGVPLLSITHRHFMDFLSNGNQVPFLLNLGRLVSHRQQACYGGESRPNLGGFLDASG